MVGSAERNLPSSGSYTRPFVDEADTVQVLVAGEAVRGDAGGDQARGITPVRLPALAVGIIAQVLEPGIGK